MTESTWSKIKEHVEISTKEETKVYKFRSTNRDEKKDTNDA